MVLTNSAIDDWAIPFSLPAESTALGLKFKNISAANADFRITIPVAFVDNTGGTLSSSTIPGALKARVIADPNTRFNYTALSGPATAGELDLSAAIPPVNQNRTIFGDSFSYGLATFDLSGVNASPGTTTFIAVEFVPDNGTAGVFFFNTAMDPAHTGYLYPNAETAWLTSPTFTGDLLNSNDFGPNRFLAMSYENISAVIETFIYVASGNSRTLSGNLAGTPVVTNDGTLVVASGVNTIQSLAGAGQTSVGAAARLVIQGAARQHALSIGPAGSVALQPGGGPMVLDQLSLGIVPAGLGKLDLGDRDLVLNYTGASPYADVMQLVLQGRTGTQGITSSLAYQGGAYPTALAVVDNSMLHVIAWAGQTISDGVNFKQILLKYTYVGDVNLDGVVDQNDVLNPVAHMGMTNATWFDGDMNFDGIVSADDLALVMNHLGAGSGGTTGGPLASVWTYASQSAVPEPAAVGLAIGLVCLLCGRRNLQWQRRTSDRGMPEERSHVAAEGRRGSSEHPVRAAA